jgi:16S rRNA (cytidine1402-2'-O)-methyltransferase
MAAKAQQRAGCLYLVATPIGNLEDITLRALRILREADLIACEDTRHTHKLLEHYDIRKRTVSYHEHNEQKRAEELAALLEGGAQVALVSDAGMPGISDPGARIVALCVERAIPVVPIPGASAAVVALAASGLPAEAFSFRGFLPSRAGERRAALAGVAALGKGAGTLIFYEAPHRLLETLAAMRDVLGNRRAAVARELTKVHEEFLTGTLDDLLRLFGERPPRGEITLLLAPPEDAASLPTAAEELTLAQRVEQLVADGANRKAALKQAARERGLAKRDAYRQMLEEKS